MPEGDPDPEEVVTGLVEEDTIQVEEDTNPVEEDTNQAEGDIIGLVEMVTEDRTEGTGPLADSTDAMDSVDTVDLVDTVN